MSADDNALVLCWSHLYVYSEADAPGSVQL